MTYNGPCKYQSVDFFAFQTNAWVGRFYSYTPDPGHEAFSFSWQQEYFYAFFYTFLCIPQIINKIQLESATGIILVVSLLPQNLGLLDFWEFLQVSHYCYQNLILSNIFHAGLEIHQTFPIFD